MQTIPVGIGRSNSTEYRIDGLLYASLTFTMPGTWAASSDW